MADAAESIGILQFALDAVVDQQQVIANNISNEDTPDYQADQVTFASSLAQALQAGGTASVDVSPEGLASATNGNDVSLPTEMSLMQDNNLENQAVDNGLTSQFTILSDAMSA